MTKYKASSADRLIVVALFVFIIFGTGRALVNKTMGIEVTYCGELQENPVLIDHFRGNADLQIKLSGIGLPFTIDTNYLYLQKGDVVSLRIKGTQPQVKKHQGEILSVVKIEQCPRGAIISE